MNASLDHRRLSRAASYAELAALPPNLVGEIIDGTLHAQPRPSVRHTLANASMQIDLGSAFHRGRGGPGGWWILVEPEVHLGGHVVVPDLAGWRRERMPRLDAEAHFRIAPDWVCEVLSPSTSRRDRTVKMRVYAEAGVPFCWLVDPGLRTLEAYALVESARWRREGAWGGEERFRAPPFDAVEFELSGWWAPAEGDHEPAEGEDEPAEAPPAPPSGG
jgi:Uma2 family endonuclease